MLLFFFALPAADSVLSEDESTLRDLSLLEDTRKVSGKVREVGSPWRCAVLP